MGAHLQGNTTDDWGTSNWELVPTPGLLKALKSDLWTRRGRYQLVETLLRSVPGATGHRLRYKFVGGKFKSIGHNVRILTGIHIRGPERLVVGSSVSIGTGAMLQCSGGLEIGDDVLIAPGVKIWTTSHVFVDQSRPIRRQGIVHRPVSIGADCWICTDAFIKPGARLPHGCVVLPKAVVGTMRIPPFAVLSGNPARVIGTRGQLGRFVRTVSAPAYKPCAHK